MNKDELVIETCNVTVFSTETASPIALQKKVLTYLKKEIFTALEKGLAAEVLEENMILDQIELDCSIEAISDSPAVLVDQIIQRIKEKIDTEKSIQEQLEIGSRIFDALENEESTHLFDQLRYFYESGIVVRPANENIPVNYTALEKRVLKAEAIPVIFKNIAVLLTHNEKARLRFIRQSSVLFQKQFFETYFSKDLAYFISEMIQFGTIPVEKRAKWLKIALSSFGESDQGFFLAVKAGKKSLLASFELFLVIKRNKIGDKSPKVDKIIKELSNALSVNENSVNQEKTGSQVYITDEFIQHLRSDQNVAALLTPFLITFNKSVIQTTSLNNWQFAFVNSLTDVKKVQQLIEQLKEFQSLKVTLERSFQAEVEKFIVNLEYAVSQLKLGVAVSLKPTVGENAQIADSDKRNKEIETSNTQNKYVEKLNSLKKEDTKKVDMKKSIIDSKKEINNNKELVFDENHIKYILKPIKVEEIVIHNAGIILLNPFLPMLFKNLTLFDEKTNWISEKAKLTAIYITHFLATGNWEATEDELYLERILTGYSLDEPLPSWKELQLSENSIKQVEEVEAPNLLNAIKDNWQPMKNCTWEGLRNDFLSREGQLAENFSESNMQYILTVTPSALDVLLPYIKWGMSMVKYSWMENILDVEWG